VSPIRTVYNNTHIWADENTHVVREHNFRHQFSLKIWGWVLFDFLRDPLNKAREETMDQKTLGLVQRKWIPLLANGFYDTIRYDMIQLLVFTPRWSKCSFLFSQNVPKGGLIPRQQLATCISMQHFLVIFFLMLPVITKKCCVLHVAGCKGTFMLDGGLLIPTWNNIVRSFTWNDQVSN
jgi:hypothetical protein